MSKSKIEWTGSTWNPITGCTKISEGCKNCYAERMAKRLYSMRNPRYLNNFELTVHEDLFDKPREWKKGRLIFVNSMSDIFHEQLSLKHIKNLFKVMNETPQHTYQLLTKRADILLKYNSELNWTDNIWMGVTVESELVKDRVQMLAETDAKVKFISFEPLLNDIGDVDLTNIDWAIVGGESGPKARPMEEDWVLNIKNICKRDKTKFYFKQWGGVNKKKTGRLLNGKVYNNMPELNLGTDG